MKRIISHIFFAAAVSLAFLSCTTQDDIYKQYVKLGGYDYPAKPIHLSTSSGFKRVVVRWEKPMDPAVKTCRLFWDNYKDSVELDYAKYPDGKVQVDLGDLQDRSYSFNIVNYDANGNKSLASEIIAAPYGDNWMASRPERAILSARMNGSDAVVVMSKATDEMVATQFRYKNRTGAWVVLDKQLKPGENEVVFPDAQPGKRFEYSSSFCPKSGLDTVWRSWLKTQDGISYELNGRRWSVSATDGQVFGENTPDKIFDGKNLSGCRWHSSKSESIKLLFPKILSVDTQTSPGNEYAFTGFRLCESTEAASLRYIKNVSIYVGSNPYDPNDASWLDHFGNPFLTAVLNTSVAEQEFNVTTAVSGRYLSLVFPDSWSKDDGYIDLWELVPYGYLPAQAD